MFGIDSGELLIIAVVALVVIGPKDLPLAMRTIGNFVARARGMARHFRSGFDAMIRESELEEMEQKWKADNNRIMRDNPLGAPESDWGKPGPDPKAIALTGPGPAPGGPPDAPRTEPPNRTPPARLGAGAPPIPPAGALPGPAAQAPTDDPQ